MDKSTHPTAAQIITTTHPNLAGKVILITGASSGLGLSAARALADTNATLFLGVRDISKAQDALSDILDGHRIQLLRLDLASITSVREAAAEFKRRSSKLHILINNGGVMMTSEGMRTEDGHQVQIGTNHLGHFLLFALLKETMVASVEKEFHARVVGVTSSAHRGCSVPEDMEMVGIDENGGYNSRLAYGQSKLANVYMMNEIERRYGAQGVHGLSVHPGGIFTGLQRFVSLQVMDKLKEPETTRYMKSVDQGAATIVLAAVGRAWEGVGRRYLEDCQEGEPVRPGYRNVDPGYDEKIWDRGRAERLWEISERMVGLQA